MDLKRWAHAVAERRSFARAAEQIHLSQPALTRSIQAAEAELGLRLFDRGRQEVVPTPAGEFVVARARQLVFNSRCLERDVEGGFYVHAGIRWPRAGRSRSSSCGATGSRRCGCHRVCAQPWLVCSAQARPPNSLRLWSATTWRC